VELNPNYFITLIKRVGVISMDGLNAAWRLVLVAASYLDR
jgi:hypothetical protein